MREMSLSRRSFIAACAGIAVPLSRAAAQSPTLAEDGLYQQPWFLESFLDLRDDFRGSLASGKLFVVIWELKNCPSCKLLHTVNFANPEIAAYAKDNFDMLQLNIVGSRPVTDLDGTELPEKDLAAKWQVRGTPTLHFFAGSEPATAREIARINYLKPGEFLEMLRFVRAGAYEKITFEGWLKANPPRI